MILLILQYHSISNASIYTLFKLHDDHPVFIDFSTSTFSYQSMKHFSYYFVLGLHDFLTFFTIAENKFMPLLIQHLAIRYTLAL